VSFNGSKNPSYESAMPPPVKDTVSGATYRTVSPAYSATVVDFGG